MGVSARGRGRAWILVWVPAGGSSTESGMLGRTGRRISMAPVSVVGSGASPQGPFPHLSPGALTLFRMVLCCPTGRGVFVVAGGSGLEWWQLSDFDSLWQLSFWPVTAGLGGWMASSCPAQGTPCSWALIVSGLALEGGLCPFASLMDSSQWCLQLPRLPKCASSCPVVPLSPLRPKTWLSPPDLKCPPKAQRAWRPLFRSL